MGALDSIKAFFAGSPEGTPPPVEEQKSQYNAQEETVAATERGVEAEANKLSPGDQDKVIKNIDELQNPDN